MEHNDATHKLEERDYSHELHRITRAIRLLDCLRSEYIFILRGHNEITIELKKSNTVEGTFNIMENGNRLGTVRMAQGVWRIATTLLSLELHTKSDSTEDLTEAVYKVRNAHSGTKWSF